MKTKPQISCAVTAQLISAFVFATQIVQFHYFLNPNFQASSHLLWLPSPVCVGPGRNPDDRFSHNEAQLLPRKVDNCFHTKGESEFLLWSQNCSNGKSLRAKSKIIIPTVTKTFIAGRYSSVGSDVAWDSRGTASGTSFREDLVMKLFLRPFFLFR